MTDSLTAPALYAVCVTPLEDARLYAAAYNAVSDARREKTDRLRSEPARRLSLAAELILRYALRSAGTELSGAFRYGAQGKPYPEDGGVQFGIAHSGDIAICAAAACEVGCDAEKIRPINLNAARRFTDGEYADILAQPDENTRLDRFFRYWTLKESFMKATGLGMKLPLNRFEIVIGDEITVIQSVDGRHFTFREFGDIPGFKCALCAAGECGDAKMHIIDVTDLL